MFVQNLVGTSHLQCNCASWLDHWVNFTGRPRHRICTVLECTNIAEVGGHVKKCIGYDNNHYIIPLCYEHNNARIGTIFEIDNSIPLVSANVVETCGKKRG